jgi:hypothetical protein
MPANWWALLFMGYPMVLMPIWTSMQNKSFQPLPILK